MDDSETAHKIRRKLKFSHILIMLLLIAVCAFAVFRLSLRFKLRARFDAIRAAGYPVTLTELNELYTIPENAENAAYTIIDAFSYYQLGDQAKLKSLPIIGKGKLPARTEPLAEETKALATQYTADNQQALELLHKAAAIKHCRYPVDLSLGHETQMPYIRDIKRGAQLLSLEAVLHSEDNKSRLAARSVTSIFGIANSLAKEPLPISQLVCTACQGLAISSLERIVNRAEFTDEQLVKLTQTVSNAEDLSTMSWAFAGERCWGISMLKNPASLSLEGDYKIPSALILELYKALGLADRDAVIYLDLMNDYMETIQLPLHQRQRAAGTIEAKLKATLKNHILLYVIMPAFSRFLTINISSIAHLRTARVALAVQRYRLVTGNLPDTLADLVPTYLDTVPKDPFDGRSLRYEKLETGFVVYSIGLDGIDDGGKERLQTGKGKKTPSYWDITFIVER